MEKIDELISELKNKSSKSINKDFEEGYNSGIRHALELVVAYKNDIKQSLQQTKPAHSKSNDWDESELDAILTDFYNEALPSDDVPVLVNKYTAEIIELVTPAPVEVPELVAEWFKLHENDVEFGIWKFIHYYTDHDKENKFYRWFNNSDNKPIETLIHMKDGYTVAKEPLYYIYDPIADQYLGYDRVEEKVWWLARYSDGAAAELTDAEISKIGQQYRAFANQWRR